MIQSYNRAGIPNAATEEERDGSEERTVRWFMQFIFARDKPIRENQVPKRLLLDPGAETPIRADASSVYYRRWLRERHVTYGAIPAHH